MLSNVSELHLIKSFSVADNKMRSGRVTDRNRQFLCQFTPVTPQLPSPCLDISSFENPVVEPNHQLAVEHNHQPVDEPNYQPVEQQPLPTQTTPETLAPNTPTQVVPRPETPESPSFVTPPTTPTLPEPPRRSTRSSKPPDRWDYDKF